MDTDKKQKVCVIGSVSMEEKLICVAKEYEQLGYEVWRPRKQPDIPLIHLIYQAFRQIQGSDEVVVVPKDNGEIGDGTIHEMVFAEVIGKSVKIHDFKKYMNMEAWK